MNKIIQIMPFGRDNNILFCLTEDGRIYRKREEFKDVSNSILSVRDYDYWEELKIEPNKK